MSTPNGHRYAWLIIGLLALAWPGQEVSAQAEDGEQLPGTVAAVIDYQRILRDAEASQSIASQIEERRKSYHDEISQEEQRLHEAEKALAKQRSILSPDALEEKQGEFQTQLASAQGLAKDRRRDLEKVSAQAVDEVRSALIEIVTGIAEERGFNLVLPSSQVLFFSRQIDLTEEVLGKLNARLPEVQVSDAID